MVTALAGRLAYRMKRPAASGQTELVLEPLEFLRRLAALVPPPSTCASTPSDNVNASAPASPSSPRSSACRSCSPGMKD